ncbi:hypothetical protein PR048_020247 [Dryococelus australis]|uniref:Uncharacterized protein n=1 Tax=Dryococelus australis TaxID=614101 RepID=A0ABQ9H5S6_9NEOP|nr:hypothetical protein PR048_020247 [Dryococelus australis]
MKVAILVEKKLAKPLIMGTDCLTQYNILLHFGGWFIAPDDSITMVILPEKWYQKRVVPQSLNEEIMQAVAAASSLDIAQQKQLYALLVDYRSVFSEAPGLNSGKNPSD